MQTFGALQQGRKANTGGGNADVYKRQGLGADDYMVKPFLPRELILRVHVILKRSYRNESNLVYLKACALDFDRAEIIRNGEHIALTAKERCV